ncbi:MAG: hypothetical protein J6X86_07175 [Bacteroidales bacterium]|nr:hypothetical protein [Bacteroidales bacterium]
MDDKEFNVLWERAKAEKYAEDLAAEYPRWRTRMRRTTGAVACLAVVLAVGLPMAIKPSQPTNQEKVYSNNKGISDQQWIALADELLMEV